MSKRCGTKANSNFERASVAANRDSLMRNCARSRRFRQAIFDKRVHQQDSWAGATDRLLFSCEAGEQTFEYTPAQLRIPDARHPEAVSREEWARPHSTSNDAEDRTLEHVLLRTSRLGRANAEDE